MAGMQVARRRARAHKEKIITGILDPHIELDDPTATEILSSFQTIKGKVHLVNKSTKSTIIEVEDVKVWLEGTATTRFQTKVDARPITQFQHTRFLPDETIDLSNVSCDIIRQDDCKEKKMLQFGTNTFPFEIQLNGEILPCSFQTPFGRIQYRLVLNVHIFWDTLCSSLQMTQKAVVCDNNVNITKSIVMTTRGCLNLNLDPTLNDPFILSKTREKFFSSRPILKANLVLNKKGFLPGETMTFQMEVQNCNCQLINLLSVTLIQKNSYWAQKRSKNTTTVLGKQEFPCETIDGEIKWDCVDGIHIPRNLMPSFTKPNRKCMDILYFVQFAVDSGGRTQLRGETMIVVGTTRQEIKGSELAVRTQYNQTTKSREDDDTISLYSFYAALPPSYSSLSSRRGSLESLPPPYDEVFQDDWDN